MNFAKCKHMEWWHALKKMGERTYWNKPNTVEFLAFVAKAIIIVPGLLFNYQIWWFYIFAVISSLALIWSSTIKTLPTLIWFNMLWIFLGTFAIVKHFINL
jgi:hypothetical protein